MVGQGHAQIGQLCADLGGPVMEQLPRIAADILHRYAGTRLLSVMAFPSDRVLSWLGSQAAAGSG
jgi:hypothetical protein